MTIVIVNELLSKKIVFESYTLCTILQHQSYKILLRILAKIYNQTHINPVYNAHFLHDQPWISQWIKLISNELDVTIHQIALQLSGHCDVISNWLWRHQQKVNWMIHGVDMWRSLFLSSFMDLFCHVRNIIMYPLFWQTVYVLTLESA